MQLERSAKEIQGMELVATGIHGYGLPARLERQLLEFHRLMRVPMRRAVLEVPQVPVKIRHV